jgi:hypothetical protein
MDSVLSPRRPTSDLRPAPRRLDNKFLVCRQDVGYEQNLNGRNTRLVFFHVGTSRCYDGSNVPTIRVRVIANQS